MATDRQIFLLEAKETRDNFVNQIHSMEWNTRHRTECESLLIMYDQAMEIIKNGMVLEAEKQNPIYFEWEIMQLKGVLNNVENDIDQSEIRKP
jgi:hypothetical protein